MCVCSVCHLNETLNFNQELQQWLGAAFTSMKDSYLSEVAPVFD